jgi:hypothetical protein
MTAKLTRMAIATAVLAAVVVGGIAVAGPGRAGDQERDCNAPLPRGSEPVDLDPADFTTRINNPYWPMSQGSRWVYRETDTEGKEQKVVVNVTSRTKKVAAGITTRVIHDLVTENGEFVEVTDDFYAQDDCGNVWYFGERTTEYENGRPVSTAGSWEAGVDGAQAGVIMPAKPRAGLQYRQEYYAGEAEDSATVLSIDEQAEVPFGHFTGVLLTKDYTPLEPKVLEYKLYARGVGPVLVLGVSGGADREELLRFTKTG